MKTLEQFSFVKRFCWVGLVLLGSGLIASWGGPDAKAEDVEHLFAATAKSWRAQDFTSVRADRLKILNTLDTPAIRAAAYESNAAVQN